MTKDILLLPHQYEVLADTSTKIIGMIGGFGNGKTFTACRKAIQLAQLNKGFTGIATEPTHDMLRNIFIPEMEKALQEWEIPYTLNRSTSTFFLKFGDYESKIICLSAENYERLVGINAAWAVMDEVDTSKQDIAEKAYQKILGRLRVGHVRQLVIFSTPEGFRFCHKCFVEELHIGNKKLIKAKTTDNKYLPEDFIDTLSSQYPPHLLEAYLNGEFVNMTSGSVYPYFNRDLHHRDLEISEGEHLHISMDFNVGGCAMTVSVIREGLPYVLNENAPKDTLHAVQWLKETYKDHDITIYPDASGAQSSTNATKSDIVLLREAGFIVDAPHSNPRIEDRVNAVNLLFSNNKIHIDTRKCPRLTKALEQQAYDERGKPEKFGGAETIDDWVDSFGYFISRKFSAHKSKAQIQQFKVV